MATLALWYVPVRTVAHTHSGVVKTKGVLALHLNFLAVSILLPGSRMAAAKGLVEKK